MSGGGASDPARHGVRAAVVSVASAWYWFNRRTAQDATNKLADAASATNDRILDLERQLAAMQANVMPISAAFQAVLIKQLTHFHTPILDALLERAADGVLTDEQEQQLADELKLRASEVDATIDNSEREAAVMLPMVMKRVRAEQGNMEGDMQVVIVPPAHE